MSRLSGRNRIWSVLLPSARNMSTPLKITTLRHLNSMCQLEASCYNDYARSCELLLREPTALKQLVYDDDMRLYAFKGEGDPLYWRMACPLGKSILGGLAASLRAAMPEGEAKEAFVAAMEEYVDFAKEPVSRAHLRFGHAESILPLYFLFVAESGESDVQIMKPPRVQTNRMGFSGRDSIPMSANFQIDL